MKIYIDIKLIIYLIIVTSTIIVLSSTNIIIIWLSIELNLFSFILLLMNKSLISEIEASINYFLSQALGSIIFLITRASVFCLYWFSAFSQILITLAILLKLGAAPCHYWFLSVIEKIRWINCFILSTWQKIIPLFILIYLIKPWIWSRRVLACLNALVGRFMGLSLLSLKKIMGCSSIAHIGWILGGIITKTPYLSITYFLIYTFIITPLFIIFKNLNNDFLYESWLKQKLPLKTKISIILLLLSLAGMPPLTGFIPKLLIINILLNHRAPVIIILIISSLLSLFFYLNIRLNIIISTQTNTKLTYIVNSTYTIELCIGTLLLGLLLIII